MATALMAAAVLLENHDDNKAIRAIRTEFQGQLFEKIRPMNRSPREHIMYANSVRQVYNWPAIEKA